jgi:argininosuccinate lyase
LERGKARLKDTVVRIDASPLGVGALAGSTIPLDREYMQSLLGFTSISENSMDTVSDRGYVLELLFTLSMILLDIGRFAEDFIIFSSREFGYIILDDSIATSSSLMPNKKNPDFFELIRAGSGKLFGYLSQLFITVKGLPMTYNKDLQEDKTPLFRGVEEAKTLIEVFHHTLKNFEPNQERMIEQLSSHLFATDMVVYLVQHGVPFRNAHGMVGEVVAYAEKVKKPLNQLTLDELHGFSPYFQEAVFSVFDPVHSIKQKKTAGSTHPTYVKMQIRKARKLIGES